jgi:hypothetical protein
MIWLACRGGSGWSGGGSHWPCPSPAQCSCLLTLGPAIWSERHSDVLYALWVWHGMLQPMKVVTAAAQGRGGQSWFQFSSFHNTSDLALIHMISVKYAFSVSSVFKFCLDRRHGDVSLAGPGAEPAATDWHCRATAAPEACLGWGHAKKVETIGNNNPSTSFSAIAKKLKWFIFNCRAGWFKLTLWRIVFGTPLHNNEGGEREDHVVILKRINQEHVNIVKSQAHEKVSRA